MIRQLPGSTLSLIIRKEHKPIIPKANTTLQAEDQIVAVTTPELEETLRTALRGT